LRAFSGSDAWYLGCRNKYYSELSWQNRWAPLFRNNVDKVLDYWRKYRFFDDITRLLSLTETSRILDVGCGISTVLHFLPGERHGIDPLAEEYKRIYRYPDGIHITQGSGRQSLSLTPILMPSSVPTCWTTHQNHRRSSRRCIGSCDLAGIWS
jgi:hypothetical protein